MFKLLEIEFINHPFFKALPIKFIGENEERAENYTTLIIGPNGTGKSQILLAAITIFNSLEELNKNNNKNYKFPYDYILHYTNNDRIHKVVYRNKELVIDGLGYRYGGEIVDLPAKVMVSAFNFNDKYPLRENRGKIINENYHYLGLKSTNNSIFIFNPPKIAIGNLYNALLQDKDILPLKEAFITLELKPEIRLIYKTGKYFSFLKNNEFWENKRLIPSEFKTSFLEFLRVNKRKKDSPELKRLGNEKIQRILNNSEQLEIVIEYLNDNIRLITELNKDIIKKQPFLNFENTDTIEEFKNDVQAFQLLNDLGLISLERFEIKKLTTNFSFDDASSGEYHIILTFLNILSLIEENSLVLIDEPEISLHPNWQIKYMDIFNKIFHRFPNTHFIIASHSHFIVSDLKSENSHILAINFDQIGNFKLTPTPKNTYGWSAEQILLDVFKVETTRNYFITKTITDVLKELSKQEPDFESVKLKLDEIIFLDISDFKDHDPLKKIFAELTTLYNEI